MTAIEYLKQLEVLSEKIKNKVRELNELRETQTVIGAVDYSKPGVKPQPKGEAAFERASDKFMAISEKICAEIAGYNAERHEIITMIHSLGSAKHIKILCKKYIELKTIEDVADEMGYSSPYTKELHTEAIRMLSEILPKS